MIMAAGTSYDGGGSTVSQAVVPPRCRATKLPILGPVYILNRSLAAALGHLPRNDWLLCRAAYGMAGTIRRRALRNERQRRAACRGVLSSQYLLSSQV